MLMDRKLWGGDSHMYYTGTFSQDEDTITAEVQTGRHTKSPGVQSVFGRDNVTIKATGTSFDRRAKIIGKSPEAPNLTFEADLTWIAE